MAPIFLSYSPQDREFAHQVRDSLAVAGYTPILDRNETPGGFPQADWIANSIKGCRALLLVLSPDAAGTHEIVQELNLAETFHCPIIPIVARASQIPASLRFQIADRRRIDFHTQPFDRAFSELKAALDEQEERAPLPPDPPVEPIKSWWNALFRDLSFPQLAASASLILALSAPCAWVLPWTSMAQFICVPLLSFAGVALGFFGLSSSRRRLAVIGITLSTLSFVALCLIVLFLIAAAFSQGA